MSSSVRVDEGWKRTSHIDALITRIEERSKSIPEDNIKQFNSRARETAPILTGSLKKAHKVRRVGPTHWMQKVYIEYGIYVNFGTRYQHAQPWWSQAWAAQKPIFKQDMKRMMKP